MKVEPQNSVAVAPHGLYLLGPDPDPTNRGKQCPASLNVDELGTPNHTNSSTVRTATENLVL